MYKLEIIIFEMVMPSFVVVVAMAISLTADPLIWQIVPALVAAWFVDAPVQGFKKLRHFKD